jgi:hypothetical protein
MKVARLPGLRVCGRFPATAMLLALVLAVGAAASAEEGSSDGAIVIGDLMWAAATNGEDVLWHPAQEYCERLELAGHRDWRLPTLEEVERLYDPEAEDNNFIVAPIVLDGCCLWTSTSLADFSAEEAGVRAGQRDGPEDYFWGFLFAGGIRYYSIYYFPDGQALCVRNVSASAQS